MEYPAELIAIVKKSSRKHKSDINAAVAQAEREIRRLDCFESLVDDLVHGAVQELVYDARHHDNVALKKASGVYSQPAKVVTGLSVDVERIASSVYTLRIAGTILGLLRGSELAAVAAREEAIANGHQFNAALCRRLMPMVPDDKTVQQAVSVRKLQAIFKEIQKQVETVAA